MRPAAIADEGPAAAAARTPLRRGQVSFAGAGKDSRRTEMFVATGADTVPMPAGAGGASAGAGAAGDAANNELGRQSWEMAVAQVHKSKMAIWIVC